MLILSIILGILFLALLVTLFIKFAGWALSLRLGSILVLIILAVAIFFVIRAI